MLIFSFLEDKVCVYARNVCKSCCITWQHLFCICYHNSCNNIWLKVLLLLLSRHTHSLSTGQEDTYILRKSVLQWCQSVLHMLVLITSSCWSLLRCSCVADSLQVALWCSPSAVRLSLCLLTWWTPLSPPHRPTYPSSSITIRVSGSVRRLPPLCLGAWAEPFPSAPSPHSPGQVSVKYYLRAEML